MLTSSLWSLAPVIATALTVACGGATARPRARGPGLGLVRADSCDRVRFHLEPAPAATGEPLVELVIAVNGSICHRQSVPPSAAIEGDIAALCGAVDAFEPGWNRVEVSLSLSDRCAASPPRIAVARTRCAAPDLD